jgi:hypothetical protein
MRCVRAFHQGRMHPLEGPFSATGVSKCGLCSVDSTISTCGSDLRQGQAFIE